MPRAYCTIDDVKQYLPSNIVTEGSNPIPNFRNPNPESVENVDMDFFIGEAGDMVDSLLADTYDVPFKKVNRGGEESYPGIIRRITAMWAAKMILQRPLLGVDEQHSETIKEIEKWVDDEIGRIRDGVTVLFGQRRTRGERFVRRTLRDSTSSKRTSNGER